MLSLLVVLCAGGIACGVIAARRQIFKNPPQLNQARNHTWLWGGLIALVNLGMVGIVILEALLVIHVKNSLLIMMPIIINVTAFLAPFVSVYIWLRIKYNMGSDFWKRIASAFIGQAIYIVLFIYLLYKFFHLNSDMPDDNFMQGVGCLAGMVLTLGAMITGFVMIVSPLKKEANQAV